MNEVREQGKGNGFTVLNPADGYRQDDHLWFGECANCGERVTNSSLDGIWQHRQMVSENTWVQIDYCPSQGEQNG